MDEGLELYEVVKEFIVTLEDYEEPIRGRVLKNLYTDSEFKYKWEVSHYYRPSEDAATVYYPDNRLARDFEGCKNVMFYYLKGFVNIDIKKNKYY